MNQIQIFASIIILQPLLLQKVADETYILGGGEKWVHMKGAKSAVIKKKLSSQLHDIKLSRKFSMI